jgi:hypothetical protein
MKIAAVALSALGLASGAAVAQAAAASMSDMDYLKASRCRGIAAGVGADAHGLDARLKTEGRSRSPTVYDRGQQEFERARRQARGDGKARLEAELNGPCAAILSGSSAVAAR